MTEWHKRRSALLGLGHAAWGEFPFRKQVMASPCPGPYNGCSQALQEGQHHQHPYHLGLCSNLHSICGAKPHRSALGRGCKQACCSRCAFACCRFAVMSIAQGRLMQNMHVPACWQDYVLVCLISRSSVKPCRCTGMRLVCALWLESCMSMPLSLSCACMQFRFATCWEPKQDGAC